MSGKPLVTIVIPSYNSADFLVEAISGVLEQTYGDFELFVVDDGSQDNTREVVEQIQDPRVHYFFKENGGVSRARNYGIERANGQYISFLDADDKWEPKKLEKQLNAIVSSGLKAAHTAFFLGDENLRLIGETRSDRSDDALEDLFFKGNVIGTPSSVLVSKDVLSVTGGFDPELSLCADWDMWIRIACETGFAYVDEPLIVYRQHDDNMSKNATLLDSDSNLMFEKAFENSKVPEDIKKRKSKALGKNYMVLAGTYFQSRNLPAFVGSAFRSLLNDPSQISYLLSFPARVAGRKKASK